MDAKKILSSITDKISGISLFSGSSIIGVDIGLSSIKLAEVIKLSQNKFKVQKFVSVPLPEGAIIEDEIQKEDEILQAIQKGLKKLSSSTRFANVGLSGPNTLIKKLQLAGGSLQEIGEQAIWESEQYLPFPIEEGAVSYSIIGENTGGGVDVIIGAAKKTVVDTFKSLADRSGFKVKIVDVSAAALANVFENTIGLELLVQGKTWGVLDIGAQKTQLLIYKNGLLVFFKEVNAGGLTITEEIQRQMGVNFEEAESLKIYGDGNGNIPEEIVEIINHVLDTFLGELKKTIDFWRSSSAEEAFDGCFITGGTAQIIGIQEALEDVFEADVKLLNPFSVMTYNENFFNDELINELTYRGITAIGLSMRGMPK